MIVKDEERFLETCLKGIKDFVDEIIVVDTGSKDKTKEIAEKFTSKIFDFKWQNDFSAARNFSLEKATSNWILVLDADEVLDDAGRAEILKLINTAENSLKDFIGFKFDQRTYIPTDPSSAVLTTDGSELSEQYKGYESSKLVRLFKNNQKIRFRNKVHELVEHSIKENAGELFESSVVLYHFSHLKKNILHGKVKTYTELMWKQLEEDPKNPRYNRQVGLAFLENGRKDLAEKYLLRALKLDSDYPRLFADLGKLYVEMNQLKTAIKFFNMAVAKNKKDTGYRCCRRY